MRVKTCYLMFNISAVRKPSKWRYILDTELSICLNLQSHDKRCRFTDLKLKLPKINIV
jgi:hypothetical protein